MKKKPFEAPLIRQLAADIAYSPNGLARLSYTSNSWQMIPEQSIVPTVTLVSIRRVVFLDLWLTCRDIAILGTLRMETRALFTVAPRSSLWYTVSENLSTCIRR
jgi:hypothetical protein